MRSGRSHLRDHPGPDAILELRRSLAHDVKHGAAIAPGAATGSLAWRIAAVAGVATFVTQVPTAFEILRWAGAIYLGFLGAQSITKAGKWITPGSPETLSKTVPASRAFWTGLIADLLNPKMGVFYLAVIPQFIPRGGPGVVDGAHGDRVRHRDHRLPMYAVLASSARKILTRCTVAAWMERVLGGVLVGFGVRVAVG
ncbi:LysE family translocator [Actinomyces sp. Marseille-P3109]|uniref:LysE family translocator n=1 Tax=Actinomyces sp. Marseille-P3109 TaxID=2083009 RepID=UPI003FA3AF0F